MKRPSTRCPASRSSAAETAESTPPESPTMTCATVSAHCLADVDAVEWQLSEQLERMARAPQVVVDRRHHQRTPVLPGAGLEVATVEPERADNCAVECHAGGRFAHAARERHPEHRAAGRALPEIEARHRIRAEHSAGLLAGLANDGVKERFAGLHVSRGLVQHDAPRRAL